MNVWSVGDIVRYSGGESALVRLVKPHGEGWLAEHCLGGTRFIFNKFPSSMEKATSKDIADFHYYRGKYFPEEYVK